MASAVPRVASQRVTSAGGTDAFDSTVLADPSKAGSASPVARPRSRACFMWLLKRTDCQEVVGKKSALTCSGVMLWIWSLVKAPTSAVLVK
jgi:hypothetical protein